MLYRKYHVSLREIDTEFYESAFLRGEIVKACMIVEKGKIEIVDIPYCGDPDEHEVVVKIKAGGICGSDMHIYHGTNAFAVYPNIMGHELAGEIHAIGKGVEGFRKGEKVAINNVLSCGECYACRQGRPNVCKNLKVLGVHTPGGFQKYLRISKHNVYPVPDNLSWAEAALVEPYSIASESMNRGRIADGDTVLICGAGPIGLMLLQAAKLHDVKVAVLDVVASRLEIARKLGADLVLNGKSDDVKQAIMEFTDNEGVSLSFEATGNLRVLEACISHYASQAGRVVVLGFSTEKMQIAPIEIMKRELDVLGTRLNNNRFPEAIDWLATGKIDPKHMISAVYPVEKVVEAFAFVDENPERTLKVVLEF